jgi:hypothetical protein
MWVWLSKNAGLLCAMAKPGAILLHRLGVDGLSFRLGRVARSSESCDYCANQHEGIDNAVHETILKN